MLKSILFICMGASAGAVSRWLLGLSLNHLFPAIPPGTIAANLIGGYLMGIALAVFANVPMAPEWRLLLMTGFLGGLTTFSAFSGEVALLMQQQRFQWAALAIGIHVVGSLTMTFLGMATISLLRRV